MLMDALDSYLSAKDEESKLRRQMAAGGDTGDVAGANSMSAADAQRLQNLQATTQQNFLEHLGTSLGARVLGKTGLDQLGVGSQSQAMQNALAYQQMRPDMLKAGSVNPAGLNGALNVQQKSGGDGESLLKMMAKMIMAG